MLRRRDVIRGLGGTILTSVQPTGTRAQDSGPVKLIGVLLNSSSTDPQTQLDVAAFRKAMERLGWSVHYNIAIAYRFGSGVGQNDESLRKNARDLVASKPDVIVVTGSALLAASEATHTIPIIFLLRSEPVVSGFAQSLARPGGNVTGFAENPIEMGSKWVELIRELDPKASRIALLFDTLDLYLPSVKTAASSLGLSAQGLHLQSSDEINSSIASFARDGNGALVISPEAFAVANRERIIASAAAYRVPAIYPFPLFSKSGGLLCYGIAREEQFQQAAGYVDRVLRGAKPSELPIQQPTKYSLIINLKTAKALGLTIPPTLLARADEVIE